MPSNLFLNRLVILTRQNKIAYDEKFHRGINIIRGENSSGKSTISHFIFYVLGGAFNDWVKEAKQCSMVIAEVELNDAVMTLRREINISPATHKGNILEPIYIFWGDYESSTKAPFSEWQKFNYNTTDDKKSFSNVFFENLDIPIVKGDNNITSHQLLRLLYVDQDSPTSSLFLYEQADTTLNRETISDLLLGVYNQDLYEKKQRLLEVASELEDIRKEIKVIKQFIPNELDLFPSHLQTKISHAEVKISEIEDEIVALREEHKVVRFTKNTKLEFQHLNDEAIRQRENMKVLEDSLSALKFEISDTEFFITALEHKVKAVRNSALTREFLGEFPLEYCPECLSSLSATEEKKQCKLCKETIDSSYGVTQARKIEQELSFQIKESRSLLAKRLRHQSELNSKYESEKVKLYSLQARVNAALKDVKSIREERIDTLYVDKGFMEGEILQYRTLLEKAEFYQSLVKKRQDLEGEQKSLALSIDSLTREQVQNKEMINKAIEKTGLYFLNNDLKRQDDFIEAKQFNVDYRNNLAFVADKEAKYSASSNFYLKTSARYAIFMASLEIAKMRYPRFILCDNMEDKGIEKERAQNFQKIIVAEAERHKNVSYQVIYTTSFIPEELNTDQYTVGEYYTEASRSLKNIQL